MDPISLNRRAFLGRSSLGLGGLALASLLGERLPAAEPGVSGFPNHSAKIKRVIFLCMAGGPSHLELFDHKPDLERFDGQGMPESFTKGQQIAQLQGKELRILAPQHPFKRYGASGQHLSTLLPHIGSIADDICIVRSMQTEQINHDTAHTFMNTGFRLAGNPSMGAWITYGLGSEADDLPGFIVLTSEGGAQGQPIAARQWHSGFLPGKYQGVKFNSSGDPVSYVRNPPGVSRDMQRELIDAVGKLNRVQAAKVDDPEVETRIAQYELAFRMQMSVPELVDFSDEPAHVKQMYGLDTNNETGFASNCLLARRLAERGVRFIHLYHRGWDHHNSIKDGIVNSCGYVDQASAALVRDLKQRGLFDDTLIVWGGEFGRTPMSQGDRGTAGRDHHIKGFSMWMAGGGMRGGIAYGSTDELGYNAIDNVVSIHDFHATMLHLLGIDHTKLTYRFQGRDFRLTDVSGHVVNGILT